MQLTGTQIRYSASDLNNYLACPYLVRLDLEAARGERPRAQRDDPSGDLVRRKGDEHERAYLELLRAQGRSIIEIVRGPAAVGDTVAALREGPDVVYQAAFRDDAWQGYADFLFKVEVPSDLGAYSYEPADTKLARGMKPYFVLQLCVYAEALARLQGVEPEFLHVILGDLRRETVARRDFAAYFRRVRERFLADVAHGRLAAHPEPVEHCGLCPWAEECRREWEAADDLCLVAGMRRDHAANLREAGLGTLTRLAEEDPAAPPDGFNPAVFARLQDQAALQLQTRRSGEPARRVLSPEEGRGLALLPAPDPGDVFFDMEGDPYVAGGLEYLFGFVPQEGGEWRFQDLWAHDAASERQAFETFVDMVSARRKRFPGMHIYHYAAYEATALKRLAGQYGTRENEIDDLLRGGVLVDLYRVVRQGLRVGRPSYSIKQLEIFYMGSRQAEVKDAGGSIVAYERWLESQDPAILAEIGRYNEEDCVSTRLLRDWLLTLRDPAMPWYSPESPVPSEAREAVQAENAALCAALLEGVEEGDARPEAAGRRLMADVLEYHRREAKPQWWAWFDRALQEDDALRDDPDCLAGLSPAGQVGVEKRSEIRRFAYPPQQHRFRSGDEAYDARTGLRAGRVVAVRDDRAEIDLKRSLSRAAEDWPEAIKPGPPIETSSQRAALVRLARAIGSGEAHRYRAAWDILTGARPRIRGISPGGPLQSGTPTETEALRLCTGLDASHLVVQGPPGAGKTYLGARLIASLVAQGARVGVSALSHKAIHNLLAETERVASKRGVALRGLKKASESDPDTRFPSAHGLIESVTDYDRFPQGGFNLLAGTAWLFCRDDMDGSLDYLFLDEAGQISLADALAMGTAARNLVLLGDPQQLPQVRQGTHPGGAGRSVLEHLLAGHLTIPPDRGLFLADTYRLHPAICRFVSEISYEERLHSAPGREKLALDPAGAGLRYLPVEHVGNSQESHQEALAIAAEVSRLLGLAYRDGRNAPRPLTEADIMVVAPYNLQVKRLRDILPAGIRVGTVDKFQGQEAPVVFFSMATSSGEDLPRTLDFLFSRHRLNVAISRAQCLAYLVASPRLLDVPCRSLDQMRMVNGLCRLVEMAS
ncbi:MAG: TM0106 family RecB-like putative nuclease [Candidatus Sericytochromatia bacterium]|nr:TM0106 family RecB-like putative nuclease [Candidatus Tanganyikabacteria bacterium]